MGFDDYRMRDRRAKEMEILYELLKEKYSPHSEEKKDAIEAQIRLQIRIIAAFPPKVTPA